MFIVHTTLFPQQKPPKLALRIQSTPIWPLRRRIDTMRAAWRRKVNVFFFFFRERITIQPYTGIYVGWSLGNHGHGFNTNNRALDRLRVVPHFSSGIVGQAKRERAWKSPHARKGDTRREERKMRDYRQSPSFWPFTPDWFWSVKIVSRSNSIKRIQWDSFSHWAVIALVIGKLQGIFIASERKPRHKFFAAVSFRSSTG